MRRQAGHGLWLRGARAIFADHAQAGAVALRLGQLVAAPRALLPEGWPDNAGVSVYRVVADSAPGRLAKTRVRLEAVS
jgi:hypothetical protein